MPPGKQVPEEATQGLVFPFPPKGRGTGAPTEDVARLGADRFERDVSFTHSVIRLEGRFRECRFGAGSDFADARTDGERDFRGSQVAGRLRLDRARFASFSLDDDLGDGRDADAIHRFRQTVRVSL